MTYNLIYVETKEEEKIVITSDSFTCYSNPPILLEDFQILKEFEMRLSG